MDSITVGIVVWNGCIEEVIAGDKEIVDRRLCDEIGVPNNLRFEHYALATSFSELGEAVRETWPQELIEEAGMLVNGELIMPYWYNQKFSESIMLDVGIQRDHEQITSADNCIASVTVSLSSPPKLLSDDAAKLAALDKAADEMGLEKNIAVDNCIRELVVNVPGNRLSEFLELIYDKDSGEGVTNVLIQCPRRYLVEECMCARQIGELVELGGD